MEENASAYAENGHNGANLEKKVQNSSSATTKSERLQVKMDIRKHQGSKNIQKQVTILKNPKPPSKNSYLYTKLVQGKSSKNQLHRKPVQDSYILTKKTKCDTMQTIKAKRLNMTSLPFAFL